MSKFFSGCAKKTIVAIAEVHGELIYGTNECGKPQKSCPRKNLPTGQGYDMCKEICGQTSHAEINLVKAAGGDLQGADVYIFGHYYACEDCLESLRSAGMGRVICSGEEE